VSLHRVDSVTLGVPDLEAAAQFYTDFGLTRTGPRSFATVDGGDQLFLTTSPWRRLAAACYAVDDEDDLMRVAAALQGLSVPASTQSGRLITADPGTGTRIELLIRPRLVPDPFPAAAVNAPGRVDRVNARAEGVVVKESVRPRRLGHFVLGTTDFETSCRFFTEGLGFKVSDIIKDFGVFLRCSTDHHNVLVQKAPVPFLHHTSWQVEDVDAIGRGAMDLLADHPERHVWGLGRHYAGSNFFWYFKDPAGNFAEYHSDMDCIPEDAIWTPEQLEGARGLFRWGPPPPPSFIEPEDLAALMISGHSTR
jgi:catechol 2,3-dioxygenase-like lactoylglutathione lyase family enzyme